MNDPEDEETLHDPCITSLCGIQNLIDGCLKFLFALRTLKPLRLVPIAVVYERGGQAARPVCFNRIDRRILIRDQNPDGQGDFQSVDGFFHLIHRPGKTVRRRAESILSLYS